MERRRCRYFCVCLLALLGTVQVWADVTGSILGYVRDKSGAVLPNATVTATQTATGYLRTVKSDSSGAYSILALPPGRYRLTASVRRRGPPRRYCAVSCGEASLDSIVL